MAIDRDAALKQAEKLLRAGRLEPAIEQYVRLIEDQPQDWNSINALGDLYLRAGRSDLAIEQYTRVADHQFSEGFLPKSAALYKKALRIKADDEHILMALAEIGERQGKFADAKLYLQTLAQHRRARGEHRAAAECILRLGSLDGSDVESKVAAAQAAQQIGDGFRAVELLKEAAATLDKARRHAEALQLLADAADVDPFDMELRHRLAREFVLAGQPDRARAYLTADTAGDDPDLLLALSRIEFADGREDEARIAMGRVLALAPAREGDVLKLADELVEDHRVESAFACIDALSDAALLQGDVPRAAQVLRTFATRTPHIGALTKLVEISIDPDMADGVRQARGQLADVLIAAGRGAEARAVAEDLLRAEPASAAHAERLRHALALLDISDPDAAIAEIGGGGQAPPNDVSPDPTEIGDGPDAAVAAAPVPKVESELTGFDLSFDPPLVEVEDVTLPSTDADPGDDGALLLELSEIDLSQALSGLTSGPPVLPASFTAPAAPAKPAVPAPRPPDIEDVFAEMRANNAREQQASAALAQYEQALQCIEQGLVREAIAALASAARVPMLRFRAATQLGRLLVDRGDLGEGIEWLERAAEAPAPTPEEGHQLLYDLAGALEAQGESARALAILMELNAETDGFRDVRSRIVDLSRAQTETRS